MPSTIKILPATEIDRTKWDACIIKAENGLIYSRYDYLQHICNNWHGLVVNDYEAVMALPWRKKYGLRYLYEPAFTQQQGLIGTTSADILNNVFAFAKYGDVLFNFNNSDIVRSQSITRTNLVIDLSKDYDLISPHFKKDLLQNLKKASRQGFQVSNENDIDSAIQLYRSFYESRFPHVKNDDFNNFKKLCLQLQSEGMCFTRKILANDGGLLAIGLFFKDEKRIYNVMNTTTELGRQSGANHFLLDTVIREFAGAKLLFDFEGSDLPGVKSFYENFGTIDQPYFHLHFNKLPFPLKLLKR